jgi:hypothetical protein
MAITPFPRSDAGRTSGVPAKGRDALRGIEPVTAARFAAHFAPMRGRLYFCMSGFALAAAE